jgi:enterochelin esterase-like enzyme
MLSTNDDDEPRFQIGTHLGTQQIFGTDAEALTPGEAAVIDASSLGYPREALTDIPAGEYYVQALINVYETFHRADGHVVKLPMDDGEGQLWESSPGNLYSEPMKVFIDPSRNETVQIALSRIVPPIDPPEDTRFVKHVRLKSQLLSEFWGRPMYLGAVVLLPDRFEEHPEARYPVLYWQDHFAPSFEGGNGGFRERPPEPELTGRERLNAEYAHRFYLDWTSARVPRMLIVSIQHANPYYDDSYGVNSANIGPYGIVQELIPHVEKEFRAIGEPWARALYGGSTGGWIALAQQIFYPDFFNGSWCFCPDPVDFRAYQQIDIYRDDQNAYWAEGEWKRVPRIDRRDTNGDITATMEDANRFEEVIGTRGRSGGQWDAWQAVYSPVGPDGYPKPIFDKRTGIINREVAQYWKEHYDLRHILERTSIEQCASWRASSKARSSRTMEVAWSTVTAAATATAVRPRCRTAFPPAPSTNATCRSSPITW